MPPACRLYLITPPAIEDLPDFARTVEGALAAGDVAALQVRLKGAPDGAVEAAVAALRPVARAHQVALILNDRPDLAARLDCDGVHIGQGDGPFSDARRLMGADRLVGVTCHDSRHLAMEAGEQGADYVAFGAFFATQTKQPKSQADIELLRWWSETMIVPSVAIGGITVQNAPALIQAGADFLAVAAGVWDYEKGPQAAVRDFNALFAT
jgi:thiamine-phosphate pyrophosphorylase